MKRRALRRARLAVGFGLAYLSALVVHWHDGQTLSPSGNDVDPIAMAVVVALGALVVWVGR